MLVQLPGVCGRMTSLPSLVSLLTLRRCGWKFSIKWLLAFRFHPRISLNPRSKGAIACPAVINLSQSKANAPYFPVSTECTGFGWVRKLLCRALVGGSLEAQSLSLCLLSFALEFWLPRILSFVCEFLILSFKVAASVSVLFLMHFELIQQRLKEKKMCTPTKYQV